MLQRVIDQPWVFLAFVLAVVVLNVFATLRVRRDRKLKRRAITDRRKPLRSGTDRRWQSRE